MWKINKGKCMRCGACVAVCPHAALELTENGIIFDSEKCASCGICEKVCPVKAIEVKK